MSLVPFGDLPAHTPRRFVPAEFDPGHWEQVAPLFDTLEQQLAACTQPAELERWLVDWSELASVLDEEGARRYVAMTCHTEDADAERAYLWFVEQLEPQLKPRHFKLEQLYLAHPLRARLPAERYLVFDREVRVRVELFRDENVPLETEEARLGQQYQKLNGALTVPFRGEEQTLIRLARYLEEPDRELRREAWELTANRRLAEADKFEAMFGQLARLRERIAHNAGLPDYRAYAFRARDRFDYTPADCLRFHEAVEHEVLPVLRELQQQRRRDLGLAALRPWDLAVDPRRQPPLRPFETVEELVTRSQRVFDQLDAGLGQEFRLLQEAGLLDLANRKGKAPGGYQATLAEARLPFIFMNAVGVQRDVETILHEAGHAFHTLAMQAEPLIAYRNPPMEFCEVASMSMELLALEFGGEFYPPLEARRARREHLEGIVEMFPWVAAIDAFQHWIYTHPGHSTGERTQAWLALMDRFGGDVDWSGYEAARAHFWHKQAHLFLAPFYYIEYGIAQLGALQVWANARKNGALDLAAYKQALALGGSKPLPALFQAAGCRFDFGRDTIRPLLGLVRDQIARLA